MALLLGLAAGNLAAAERPIRYEELHPEFREFLGKQNVSGSGFENFLRAIEQSTAERLRLGEDEHLIAFVLQSQRFTAQPRVEPALSAREFVEEGEKIPQPAARRIEEFAASLRKPASDQRLSYFRAFVKKNAGDSPDEYLRSAYRRSMLFLYQKEWVAKELEPSRKGGFLAGLYEKRGHSSDTQLEANFAVFTALSVVRALAPAERLDRVLVVGPGLDFAPRTGFSDAYPPQSFQPFAVADALLGLGLSDARRLRIHCVDINERVIRYFQRKPKRLTIFSALQTSAEYGDYFRKFGTSIGRPAGPARPRQRTLQLRSDVVERISAQRMNIVTERYEPSPAYDLVVVTNVLPYFSAGELLLALSNIHSMLREGGYLIHNEFRPEVDSFTRTLGLAAVQARTVQLSEGTADPLLDGFVIHRKQAGGL